MLGRASIECPTSNVELSVAILIQAHRMMDKQTGMSRRGFAARERGKSADASNPAASARRVDFENSGTSRRKLIGTIGQCLAAERYRPVANRGESSTRARDSTSTAADVVKSTLTVLSR